MNTWYYRENAREAEGRSEWRQAARYWHAAIANYPTTVGGEIAEMRQRRDAALDMLSRFHPLQRLRKLAL